MQQPAELHDPKASALHDRCVSARCAVSAGSDAHFTTQSDGKPPFTSRLTLRSEVLRSDGCKLQVGTGDGRRSGTPAFPLEHAGTTAQVSLDDFQVAMPTSHSAMITICAMANLLVGRERYAGVASRNRIYPDTCSPCLTPLMKVTSRSHGLT